ncbi:hypothetical protein F0562_026293 [Nyssa sinensis]|uniref:Uncharacterized protein n=1 Tax=Nyssa sinensis TaxID=561372 RepID=A0A5J5BEN1_9ASTE|nr:hypothetical protein F0562_026293 [Nyssa sinensis]
MALGRGPKRGIVIVPSVATYTLLEAYLWRPTSEVLALPSLLAMLALEVWFYHLWRHVFATSGGMSLPPLEALALASSGWRFWLSSGGASSDELRFIVLTTRSVVHTSGGLPLKLSRGLALPPLEACLCHLWRRWL